MVQVIAVFKNSWKAVIALVGASAVALVPQIGEVVSETVDSVVLVLVTAASVWLKKNTEL